MAGWQAEQIATLDAEQKARFDALVGRLRALGAADPEGWALSEVQENIPQTTYFLLLRAIWRDCIVPPATLASWMHLVIGQAEQQPWRSDNELGQVLKRLVDAGAQPADLQRFAELTALDAIFKLAYLLDYGRDYEWQDAEDLPGWGLVERTPEGKPTGRILQGLHEYTSSDLGDSFTSEIHERSRATGG